MTSHKAKSDHTMPQPSPLLESAKVYHLNINDIALNQDQPRKTFDEHTLIELAESIKQHGVIQPVIVTKQGLHYRLVAGERRWRASRMAGMPTIPAIVRELSDRDVMQQALIENIQREDLKPLEESRAYHRLLHDYRLTQEQLAEVVGKSRSTVANSLRLIQLPNGIQELLNDGMITAGHARAILSLNGSEHQSLFAQVIVDESLSVRSSEKRAKSFEKDIVKLKRRNTQRVLESESDNPSPSPLESQRVLIENELMRRLDRKVHLDLDEQSPGKGRVTLSFDTVDDMERLLETLGLNLDRLD